MQLKFDEAMEMARLHRRQKRYAEAKALYERILEAVPKHPGALYELALVARGLGKLEIAVNFMLQSLQQDDTNVAVYVDLGEVHLELENYDAAKAAARRALTFEPERLEALMILGHALLELGRFKEAAETFGEAVKGRPKFGDGYFQMGRALYGHGKPEKAAVAYRRSLQLDPTQWGTLNNLAASYQEMGKTDRAVSVFRQALKRNPRMPRAQFGLGLIKRFTPGDARFDEIKRLLDLPDLSGNERGYLLYALGRAHDDIGAHDEAFACVRQANEERAKDFPYDRGAIDDRTKDTIAADSAMVPGLQADPTGQVVPVFVVGLSRSGKTLTESLLASSPGVADGREKGYFRMALEHTAWKESLPDYPDNLPKFDQAHLTAIGRRYHEMFAEFITNKESHIVNTSPLNIQYVGPILRCLPNAKVVYCERDFLDHALYIYFKRYEEWHPYAYKLGDAAHYIENSRRLMRYWIESYGEDRILSIHYEDLVTNPRPTIDKVTDFLGVERLPAKVTKGVHANEVGQWRHYEHHLEELRSHMPVSEPRKQVSGVR